MLTSHPNDLLSQTDYVFFCNAMAFQFKYYTSMVDQALPTTCHITMLKLKADVVKQQLHVAKVTQPLLICGVLIIHTTNHEITKVFDLGPL